MSMILYHGQPNGPSLTVLATLFETGLDAELRPIDLLKGERHTIPGLTDRLALDMSVEGEGPVLVVDGEAMTDSVFIAQYLDEMAGGGLQSADPYAHWEMLMMCRRITERASPAAAYLGNMLHAHCALAALDDATFDSRVAPIASPDLAQRWRDLRGGHFADEQIADSRSKLAHSAGVAEELLADGRDWLMGEFSIVDLTSYAWHADLDDLAPGVLDGCPRLREWLARMRARPSIQQAHALATVPQPEHYWAPGPEINRWG
jgi:GSH-dependent disulfide-bond oxidoreductase